MKIAHKNGSTPKFAQNRDRHSHYGLLQQNAFLSRRVFRILPNIYDEAFSRK